MSRTGTERSLLLRTLLWGSDSSSPRQLVWVAVACFLFSSLGISKWDLDSMGITHRLELSPVTGVVTSRALGPYVKGSPSNVSFALNSTEKVVYLPSKGWGVGLLHDAVPIGARLRVLVEGSCVEDVEESKCVFWSIDIDGEPYRTFESISEAWAKDNRAGLWIGIGFGLSGLLCLFQSRFAKAVPAPPNKALNADAE